ncbi:MAG: FAD-dependent oxidoreductase [Lentisphaerae bacterium]|nr:FAD-dependent oxidoreductase [Lentisphaerota bacterium]
MTTTSQPEQKQHRRFHIRSIEELRSAAATLGLDLPVSDDVSVLAEPVPVGKVKMPNRFLVQPMEGFDADADGAPGELSFRRYRRYAEGGFGTIWIEATAVAAEARSNPGQFYLHDGSAGMFARLVSSIRKTARAAFGHDVVIIIQLTHSGRYSKPHGIPRPIIAHHSPVLDPIHRLPKDYPLISDGELDRLQDAYVNAARLAEAAGVDGVDVKSCHRYLVSELLASHTREGRYGGSFENRARFLLETAGRIGAETGGIFATTRMNAFDAIPHPYGFGMKTDGSLTPDLSEPLKLAEGLAAAGAPLLNVSIGNPYFNPHYGRPFDFPVYGAPVPEEHPLTGLKRFLDITAAVQRSMPGVPVVGSGYSWLRQFMPNVAAAVIRSGGAALLGVGRGAFAYPDCVRDVLQSGKMDPAKCCVTCSACTQIMRDGGKTGCVVRDSDVYGPQYRLARRFAVDRLRAEAGRCRECEEPTCAAGCPAHIEIPSFLRAFADGDIAGAYNILRMSNLLPEMCGFVCPAEVQCEGSCIEDVFCRNPIPIRDIQLVTSRLARLQGLTGVRLPAKTSGRRAAVVGGGPAGVACAVRLLELGHTVVLFERGNRLGGVPAEAIPGERLSDPEEEIGAILAPAVAAGRIEIRYGMTLGVSVRLEALTAEFDSVMLAVGMAEPNPAGRPGGVVGAIEFLKESKSGAFKNIPGRVAVIGGGNTAIDAATEACRLGARDVYLLYRRSFAEMPAWPDERDRLIARGVHLLVLTQPVGYVTDGSGQLQGLRIARTELLDPDVSGRRRPSVVAGSESILDVGLAVEATGQGVSVRVREALAGLEFTDSGLLAVKPGSFRTSNSRVFAAGDLVNGGTTAVRGIAEAMKAAGEMDLAMRAPAAERKAKQ